MKLNIYEKRRIVKTYEADTYDLMFGVLEDVVKVVNLDKLTTGSDAELIRLVGETVLSSMDSIKELLKDIFEGLTDDEIKHTRVSEIGAVILDVVKYTMQNLKALNSKN